MSHAVAQLNNNKFTVYPLTSTCCSLPSPSSLLPNSRGVQQEGTPVHLLEPTTIHLELGTTTIQQTIYMKAQQTSR